MSKRNFTDAADNRPIRIYCCVCGKQAVKERNPGRYNPFVTKAEGGRAGFKQNEIFCGYCAEDMDENGLFPEERELLS